MRRRGLTRRERGQTLVIVAVAMIGLLALAGLAVDGGNLFMQRREAQNAADAAALAGTRLIAMAMMTCNRGEGFIGNLDHAVACEVNEYAEQNGISDTDPACEVNGNVTAYYVNSSETRLATVGDGTVPLDTSGVEVLVRDESPTYFMQVVGVSEIPSTAQAMAMAGVVTQLPPGSDLIPVGVPEVVLDPAERETVDTVNWEVHRTGDNEFCYTDSEGDLICPEDPGSPQDSLRGWLNLNHIFNRDYTSATEDLNRTYEQSASDDACQDAPKLPGLRGWASGLCSDRTPPIYAGTSGNVWDPDEGRLVWGDDPKLDGDFIHGAGGATPNALKAIYEAYGGGEAYAPVFDKVYLYSDMETFFPEEEQAEPPTIYHNWATGEVMDVDWPNGGGFSSSAGGSGDSWYYHIVGWVSAAIPYLPKEGEVLYGGFAAKSITTGLIDVSTLGGTCSLMLHGVTLWR